MIPYIPIQRVQSIEIQDVQMHHLDGSDYLFFTRKLLIRHLENGAPRTSEYWLSADSIEELQVNEVSEGRLLVSECQLAEGQLDDNPFA